MQVTKSFTNEEHCFPAGNAGVVANIGADETIKDMGKRYMANQRVSDVANPIANVMAIGMVIQRRGGNGPG